LDKYIDAEINSALRKLNQYRQPELVSGSLILVTQNIRQRKTCDKKISRGVIHVL